MEPICSVGLFLKNCSALINFYFHIAAKGDVAGALGPQSERSLASMDVARRASACCRALPL